MTKPIAKVLDTPIIVDFTVRDPQSVNAKWIRSRGKGGDARGLYANPVVKAFEERVANGGFVAIMNTAWPRNVWRIAGVTISYRLFDCRLDADACIKSVRDALEGIAYQNDRVVDVADLPRPVKDGKGRRIEIRLELKEVFDEAAAVALQVASATRRVRSRSSRKPKRLCKPHFIE